MLTGVYTLEPPSSRSEGGTLNDFALAFSSLIWRPRSTNGSLCDRHALGWQPTPAMVMQMPGTEGAEHAAAPGGGLDDIDEEAD